MLVDVFATDKRKGQLIKMKKLRYINNTNKDHGLSDRQNYSFAEEQRS